MSASSDDRTLFIGNLDKKVADDVLYELFLQAGPIERVNIVTNKNNATHFGFVTYKHEMSIDYAIELFKGTYLFHKELAIKKKGRSNGNGQMCDSSKNRSMESGDSHGQRNMNQRQFDQDSLSNGYQSFRQNPNADSPAVFNFKGNSQEGNWQARNKPYDHGSRNYSSRYNDQRRMYKGRPPVGKSYHNRKSRY